MIHTTETKNHLCTTLVDSNTPPRQLTYYSRSKAHKNTLLSVHTVHMLRSTAAVCAPLNAGYVLSARRTILDCRLNVLALLALVSAGELPTYILHEDTHSVTRAIEVSNAACKDA